MSDQPTPATCPDDRPITLLTDEAPLVPAHLLPLLAALTAPAPEETANPDPAARDDAADPWAITPADPGAPF